MASRAFVRTRGRMVGCDGFWLAAANRRADQIVDRWRGERLADALGNCAFSLRRLVGCGTAKEAVPIAVALHSPPRRGRGERLLTTYVKEQVIDVGNSYVVNSEC